MSRLSPSFWRFEERLSEVSHLKEIAKKYTQLGSLVNSKDQASHASTLVRAATVLLSSHIQGYVEDLSDLVISRLVADQVLANKIPDSLIFHSTKHLIREIKEANDPNKIIEKIRLYKNEYGDVIEKSGMTSSKFIDGSYKDGFGNPTTAEIKKFFNRFGMNDFNTKIAGKLKGEWLLTENAINQIIDLRNKIAHGNVLATLTVSELSQYMKLSRKFASAADRVVTSHFGSMGCKFWLDAD